MIALGSGEFVVLVVVFAVAGSAIRVSLEVSRIFPAWGGTRLTTGIQAAHPASFGGVVTIHRWNKRTFPLTLRL